jgi:arabinoxylan arabinofuranohydrolase
MKTMNNKMLLSVFIMLITCFSVTICFADNPVVQTKYTSDPAPMVYDGMVYLYTGHDEDDATSFKMKNWLLYTSTDMVNWTDRGIAASLSAFTWADPNNGAWASQCIYRNGKFYWYCAVQLRGIGVLVSTSPYGPFTDPIGKALINNSSDDIDPTVWIDDDGQAYMYWGNPNCYYIKLNQDMISYSGGITKISSKPSDYQEGPWLHKRNGIYYLSYSSTCCPEGIGYAMSNSPIGPWTWKGKIMDPNSASSGNQPGIIDYKGNTYCFGFNYYLNYLETTEHRERRSVCVDIMNYNADGTIVKMPWWTSTGAPQIGVFNPYVQTEAETICFSSGIKSEVCGEGGIDICNIENGDYIKVKGVDFGTGATSFDARVSSANSGGNIEIRIDSSSGTLVGTCAVSGTGGWQTWVTKSCSISGVTGVHDLYFRFTGGSGSLFNFNWWKFTTNGSTPDPTAAPTAVPTMGPTPVPGSITIACGSSSAVGSFQPDQYYSGGSTFNNTNTVDVSQITSNPPPPELFNNERFGAMIYTIPGFTAGGSYEVTLYFAETYLTSSGSRLFNVSINGTAALSSFDIYATAGGQNKAIARSFTTTADSSGQIAIQFTAVTENPKINGIAINPGSNNGTLGDVNGSATIDIVDALLIAQYYVGLNPSGFVAANADVNCSGSIDIVDALLVAQYYVGLITSFTC